VVVVAVVLVVVILVVAIQHRNTTPLLVVVVRVVYWKGVVAVLGGHQLELGGWSGRGRRINGPASQH
jgi:hypothetical protein